MRFTGRVIAITGASSGIGLACAERLASDGAAVVLCARGADRLNDVASAITARGVGRAMPVPGDVTNDSDMRSLVARAVDAFGHLDVILCNAGVGLDAPFYTTALADIRRLVDVNLMGTFNAAHAAMHLFTRQGHGHIIAVSSIVGRRGIAGSGVYGATKAAQRGFIESLRAEFVGTPFHASIVFPISTLGPRQPVDRVAVAIADCIAKPRAEVYPSPRSRLLGVLSVIAPARADRLVQRLRPSARFFS